MPQLAECFCLDLSDAFARYVKLSADFFQRVVGVHIDAETHTQDFCLTRCQAFEDFFGYFVQAGVHCRIGKRNIVGIFDEVAQVRIVVVADGGFHRNRLFGDFHDFADFVFGHLHQFGKFGGIGFFAGFQRVGARCGSSC